MTRAPGSTTKDDHSGAEAPLFFKVLLAKACLESFWALASKMSVCEGYRLQPEHSGEPIPEAKIVVLHDKKQVELAKGDSNGRFNVTVPSGEYFLEASNSPFQSLNLNAYVGPRFQVFARQTTLYITLGLAGSFCSWANTSKREFRREIRANHRRIDEATHRNATQN